MRNGCLGILLVSFLTVCLACVSHARTAQPSAAVEQLRADIDKVLARAGLGKTTVAVHAVALAAPPDHARNDVLYALRPDVPLIPASTMKLVTTAACFDRLGPGWRIRTHIGRIPSPRPKASAAARNTKAKWDLAVIGGGDPNLSGRFYGGDTVGAFRRWAEVLKGRGVTAVERVLLDDTLFDKVLVHPNWPANQRAEWYEAPTGALSINDNCLNVHVAPGTVGGPARVWVEPPGGAARITGRILTVADRKAHRFSLERVVEESGLVIRAAGKYWAKAPAVVEFRALDDPTRVFGAALVHTLRASGIAVAGPVLRARLAAPDGAARADFLCDLVHTSRLDATIAVANKRSQGMYAECLLKLLGAYGLTPHVTTPLPPRQGSWESGAEEVRRWLTERGVPNAGCVFDDGSGLSRQNRLTAFTVTHLLGLMHRLYGPQWVQTLAVAGRDGSLRNRMDGTAAEGRVYGKTGYVRGVSALSGYVYAASGRVIAYAILMNRLPPAALWKARLAQDKICIRLVDL